MKKKRVRKRRHGIAIVSTPKGILVVAGRRGPFILPGGGAGKRESRHRAALRELFEETGLKAKESVYAFSHIGPPHKDYRGGYFQNYSKVFVVKAEGTPRPRHEVKRIAFYRILRMPWHPPNPRISRTTRRILLKYALWRLFHPFF